MSVKRQPHGGLRRGCARAQHEGQRGGGLQQRVPESVLPAGEDASQPEGVGGGGFDEDGVQPQPTKPGRRKADSREVLKNQLEWLSEQLALGPAKFEEAERPPADSNLVLPPRVLLEGFQRLPHQTIQAPAGGPPGPRPLSLKAFVSLCRRCAAAKPVECRDEGIRAAAGVPRDVLSAHLERALQNQQRAKEARNQQAAREAAAEAAAAAARAAAAAAAEDAGQGQGGAEPPQQYQQGQGAQQYPLHSDGLAPNGSWQPGGGPPGHNASAPYRQWTGDPYEEAPSTSGLPSNGGGGPWEHQRPPNGGPFPDGASVKQFDGSAGFAEGRDPRPCNFSGNNSSSSSSSSSSSRYHVSAGDYDAWAGPVALSTVECGDWESRSFPWDAEVQRVNRTVFKNFSFRPMQKSVINAVLSARDVFVMMPTGGGKSLCFQLPAVVHRGVTAVVMPLLSLMQDQMGQLQELGVECRAFTSNQTWEEQRQVYEELRDEDSPIHLVFLTPEKLNGSKALRSALHELNRQGRLSRFAIDEAHCVSQWGNDFRPDYCQLRRLREEFPNVPIVALTATATVAVLQDVQRQLGMREPVVFQRSFDRPNLRYEVVQKQRLRAVQQVVELILQHFKGLCGIVYCLSQRDCEKVAEGLEEAGIAAAYYHAKLDADRREHVQRSWMQNRYKVIVATLAFGMGVNKKDVRFVIHTAMPKSLENFYQESGRAGRDGEEARCILLYDYHDKQRQTFLMQAGSEGRGRWAKGQQGQQNASNLLVMLKYCEELFECRRVFILRHFGEDFRGSCDTECDNCKRRRTVKPYVVPCGKLASEVVALVRGLLSKAPSFPLTLASLRDALLGRKAKGNRYQQMMQAHPQFGCLQRARWTQAATARLLHSLVIHEVLWERCVASSNQPGSFTTYIELGRQAGGTETSVLSLVMDEPPTGGTRRNTKADADPQQPPRNSPASGALGEPPLKKSRIVSSGGTVSSRSTPVAATTDNRIGSVAAQANEGAGGQRPVPVGGPLPPALADALTKRLLNVRDDLARRASLRTTKSIATKAAIEAIARELPATLAQLQALPFKELQGGKKGEKYGQVFVAEVRAFLCENRLTHLLKEDVRGMPPPGAPSCFKAASRAADEEFVSIGGPAESPQDPKGAVGTGSCHDSVLFDPSSTQPCVSQSMYFRPERSPMPPEGPTSSRHVNIPGSTLGNSQRGPPLYQQQPREWQQKPASLPPLPPHDVVGQSACAAPDLWDPEDLDCLDYL